MFTSFADVLAWRAGLDPGRPAVLCGDEVLSFGDWQARASRLAGWYARRGAPAGSRVLLWMDSSPAMAVAMLGLWRAGAIFALIDPKAKAAHFTHAVATIDPVLVLCDRHDALPAEVDTRNVPVVAVADAGGDEGAEPLPPAPTLRSQPASIVFTSGSTGRPKGVTQSHGNLLRACEAVSGYLGLTAEDRILCPVPWSFDYGYGQLLSTLLCGSTQVLPLAANPFAICAAITRHQPTVLAGIPSLFTYLLRGVSPFRDTDLSSLRTLTNTGGRIPGPVFEELRALLPGRRIFLNYGLTETYRTSYLDPSLAATHPASIGRAIPGADVIIVREDGSPAAAGETGQIVHRGDYICLGYWNDPEATARALRPDPLAPPGCPNPGPALFTGDFGWKDDAGLLYFGGRRDSQLKSMGVRVNPSEIEETLHGSGLVTDVAVVGRPHELLGDEICAFIVSPRGEAVVRELTAYARERLSPYMLPRRFLVRDALPRTTTGKADYPALREEARGL